MAAEPTDAPPPPRRTIGLCWSLYRNLVLLVLVVAGSVFIVQQWLAERTRVELSHELLERAADETAHALDRFLDPVGQMLEVTEAYALSGVLDFEDAVAMNRIFWPILTEYPQISSVSMATPAGDSYMLLHIPGGWVNRVVRPESWGEASSWQEWSPDREFQREYWRQSTFDARERPWFRGAAQLGPGEVYWSEPYTFFTTQQPGITAAIHINGGTDRQLIAAFDVRLSDISNFTRQLRISPDSKVAVVTAADRPRVLGLPADPRFDAPIEASSLMLRPVDDLPLPELKAALARWDAAGRELVDVAFEEDGVTWRAAFRRYPLGQGPVLWIVVLIPESDFFAESASYQMSLLAITAAGLGLAIFLALALARTYTRPLEELAAAAERLSDLDTAEPVAVRSRIHEMQVLARSQERIRRALDAFAHYGPLRVVRELMHRGQAAEVGGSREIITAVFSDVTGFADIAARLEPEELARHLSAYFHIALDELDRGGATVERVMGDAIMAFWGGLRPTPGHAVDAVATVLVLREALRRANRSWEATGQPCFETRFGLASGEAVVGNVGGAGQLTYTAIGDTVNLAARLEGLARRYGVEVLASEHTVVAAGDRFAWRELDRVRLKGRPQPVAIFELLGQRDGLAPEVQEFADRYARALSLYRQREFRAAVRALNDLGRETGRLDDRSLEQLRQACERGRVTKAGDWQPVTDLT